MKSYSSVLTILYASLSFTLCSAATHDANTLWDVLVDPAAKRLTTKSAFLSTVSTNPKDLLEDEFGYVERILATLQKPPAAAPRHVPITASGDGLIPGLSRALQEAYSADQDTVIGILASSDIPVAKRDAPSLARSIALFIAPDAQEALLKTLQGIGPVTAPPAWAYEDAYEPAPAYRAAPAPRSILTVDEKGFIEAASKAIAGVADGTDVHHVNRTILVTYAATLQSYMPRLAIPATPGILEEVRKAATDFYAPGAEELGHINNVLGRINAGSSSGELGITAHDALWRAHVLAKRCDALRGPRDTTFQSFALKMISQNIEEAGGCVDGIVGRAILVQIKCLQYLKENYQL